MAKKINTISNDIRTIENNINAKINELESLRAQLNTKRLANSITFEFVDVKLTIKPYQDTLFVEVSNNASDSIKFSMKASQASSVKDYLTDILSEPSQQ